MRVIDSMWNRMTWQGAEDDYLRFLAGVVGECRIACPHPGKPYTSCGTTIFRITREGFRTFTPNPDEILEYPPSRMVPQKIKYNTPTGHEIDVYVHKIIGVCPYCIEGTKFRMRGCKCVDPGICGYAMNTLYQYVSAMSLGAKAIDIGITEKGDDGFVSCPSWGPPTCEGKVVFRLEPVPNEEPFGDDYYKTLADLGHSMIPEYYLKNYASEETQQKKAKLIQE